METLLQIPRRDSEAEDARQPLHVRVERGDRAGKRRDEAGVPSPRWDLASLAGRIIEISAPGPAAGLTAAARLIREAQEQGEPAAWIAAGDSVPYAPDAHDSGIDLAALPIVRLNGTVPAARAAEHLLRSGAFGLIVIDFGGGCGSGGPVQSGHLGSRAGVPGSGRSGVSRYGPACSSTLSSAVQARLAALCRHHQAALLLLARRGPSAAPVLSFASVRAEGSLEKTAFDRFALKVHVFKDKAQGAAWAHEEICRGTDGLC